MTEYFEKYPIHLILRDGIPKDRIKNEDRGEVEQLEIIREYIKEYIYDVNLSDFKTKDELYNSIEEHFSFKYPMNDIKTVCKIDDDLNINCVDCNDCKYCLDCVKCSNCINCQICFRCNECKNTINRRNEENLINDDSHFPLIIGQTFTPDDIELDKELGLK